MCGGVGVSVGGGVSVCVCVYHYGIKALINCYNTITYRTKNFMFSTITCIKIVYKLISFYCKKTTTILKGNWIFVKNEVEYVKYHDIIPILVFSTH